MKRALLLILLSLPLAALAVDVLSGVIRLDSTDSTASPGAATIDKPSGRSAVAAGAASVVITSARVLATSNIQLTALSANNTTTTCLGYYVSTVADGSFTVTCPAGNSTAAWKFMWVVHGAK